MTERAHLLVLPDQLTDQVGPVRDALLGGAPVRIIMVESRDAQPAPRHVQALVTQRAAGREFAAEMRAKGLHVDLIQSGTFEEGLTTARTKDSFATLTLMEPSAPQLTARLHAWASSAAVTLEITPNELWLTTREEWEEFARGRKELRMEFWYRRVRAARGWLMEPDRSAEPLGGVWNLDQENRQRLPKGATVPGTPTFPPSGTAALVADEVRAESSKHFGLLDAFGWPTSRAQALEALERFCTERLAAFGPYEDAMSTQHEHLYHSLLSSAINLGLLTPHEVCLRAIKEFEGSRGTIPLQSVEGFIRQILGWREFMHHTYVTFWREWESANGLSHHESLPSFYWSGETKMACISRVVRKLIKGGHAHHIERLMLLGNFALLIGVKPQEVDAWFLEAFVDAHPWVVTPNVVAMSQFADLGKITSKPYIAGGAYVSRMGDDCSDCFYDPKLSVGEHACPLTTLYWDFIDRHAERFAKNPRMARQVRSWESRKESIRTEILEQAKLIRASAKSGNL
ncbi:MAG: cryptochrome/photolyase family protein [Candidatus Limnocylindrus sp.]|jgi:deoxyribodipyrimidine photolyase-related protein